MNTSKIVLGPGLALACTLALAAPHTLSTDIRETQQTAQGNAPPSAAKDAGGAPVVYSCPGFANTRLIDLSWSNPQRMYTRDAGGLGVKDVLVVRFTTGPNSSAGKLPRIAAAEFRSAPNWRVATLSSKPCDFGPQSTPGATMTGNSITAVFALGTDPGSEYYPVLETNRTYYLNIRNSADSNCAASGVCDMFVDLIKSGDL